MGAQGSRQQATAGGRCRSWSCNRSTGSMAAASLDASTCGSSADLIFKTQVLRPFLHRRQVDQAEATTKGFLKPSPILHRRSASDPSLLRPFQCNELPGLSAQRLRQPATGSRSYITGQARSWRPAPQRARFGPSSQARQQGSTCEHLQGCMDKAHQAAHTYDDFGDVGHSSGTVPLLDRTWDMCSNFSDSLEDPMLMPFSEEPDDARVYMPAHRIGDLPPDGWRSKAATLSLPSRNSGRRGSNRSCSSGSSQVLLLDGTPLPVHGAPRGRGGGR